MHVRNKSIRAMAPLPFCAGITGLIGSNRARVIVPGHPIVTDAAFGPGATFDSPVDILTVNAANPSVWMVTN